MDICLSIERSLLEPIQSSVTGTTLFIHIASTIEFPEFLAIPEFTAIK